VDLDAEHRALVSPAQILYAPSPASDDRLAISADAPFAAAHPGPIGAIPEPG
jgi:hypothetical protein